MDDMYFRTLEISENIYNLKLENNRWKSKIKNAFEVDGSSWVRYFRNNFDTSKVFRKITKNLGVLDIQKILLKSRA